MSNYAKPKKNKGGKALAGSGDVMGAMRALSGRGREGGGRGSFKQFKEGSFKVAKDGDAYEDEYDDGLGSIDPVIISSVTALREGSDNEERAFAVRPLPTCFFSLSLSFLLVYFCSQLTFPRILFCSSTTSLICLILFQKAGDLTAGRSLLSLVRTVWAWLSKSLSFAPFVFIFRPKTPSLEVDICTIHSSSAQRRQKGVRSWNLTNGSKPLLLSGRDRFPSVLIFKDFVNGE